MVGLTVQNFLSAATGIAVAVALIRGFARASTQDVGNFWVDLTRITLYVLLPISHRLALFLVAQGMPQTLGRLASRRRRSKAAKQTIAARPGRLPDRDQDARHQRRRLLQRQLGASVREPDGAGELRADAVDLRDRRRADQRLRPHGRRRAPGLGDPRRDGRAVRRRRRASPTGPRRRATRCSTRSASTRRGNMEGKEVRFGIGARALFAVITTAASCGAVNAMHDSFMPLGGLVPLFNMQLGEIIVGGVGAGLYGMLIFVLLAVFIAGLMVGPHAGIPRQEDRGARGQAGHARHPVAAAGILGFTAVAGGAAARRWPRSPTPGRTASPRSSTPTPRPRQQRLGLRRADRQHALVQH